MSVDALRPSRPARARVHNFTVSEDGIAAGLHQSLERPFNDADPARLMSWAGSTDSWPHRTDPGGSCGLDDHIVRDFTHNIGAEIMGRNKFGPVRGSWPDKDWTGWWGDDPPFHTPVFVLTHHPRPSFSLGETTFHFLDAAPEEARKVAMDAANGRDIRVGGGVSTVLEFLEADLIDDLHVAVAPVEFGDGRRLCSSPADLENRFRHESVLSLSGVAHHFFWRR